MSGFWRSLGPGREEFVPYQYTTVNIEPEPPMQPFPTQPVVQPPVQAQPPQVQAPPQRVAAWEKVLNSLLDPKVLGPLQTFLGSMSVPLSRGETMASRMAYSSALMQIHKRMLEENEQELPRQQQEQELRMRQLAAQTTQAETAAARGQRTLDIDVARAKQEYENAVRAGDVQAAELAKQQLENKLDEKYAAMEREAKLRLLNAQIGALGRQGMGGGGGAARTNEGEIRNAVATVESYLNAYRQSLVDPLAPFDSSGYKDQAEAFKAWLTKLTPAQQAAYYKAASIYKGYYGRLPIIYPPGQEKTQMPQPQDVRTLEQVRQQVEAGKQKQAQAQAQAPDQSAVAATLAKAKQVYQKGGHIWIVDETGKRRHVMPMPRPSYRYMWEDHPNPDWPKWEPLLRQYGLIK